MNQLDYNDTPMKPENLAASAGKKITKEELKKAEDIGKENEKKAYDVIKERFEEMEKDNPKYKDEGIKNIKTNRSQWFD